MIDSTISTKIDVSGLEKLIKQFNKPKVVQVGWIDSDPHWRGDGVFTTAALASNLHYWSKWGLNSGHSFMINDADTVEVASVVSKVVNGSVFENPNIALNAIGSALSTVIKHRIDTTYSPQNESSWAARKRVETGSDHPLMYGKNKGESLNLYDEVTWRVI